jgi:hypothetical protein
MKKEFKIGDNVIYALNGKWFSRNCINYKSGQINDIKNINGIKFYSIEFKNSLGIIINNIETYMTKEIELEIN